ncbi:MAG: hypothetical protein KGI75_17560 [Rhizobiaceae bacterium]|nr:hypothetical protein [Rhizobiaceae bacterium]
MRFAKIEPFLAFILMASTAIPALCADAPQQTGAPQPQASQISMSDFMKGDSSCVEFNDHCSYCKVTNGVAECSTPQIACIKQAYQCTKSAGQ